MYAKFTVLLLALLCIHSSSWGQTQDVFSLQKTQVYKQNSLSIDLSGLQVTNEYGETLQMSCSTCWTPYQGYERLSEAVFFRIAGHDQLAEQARRSKRNKLIAIGLGGLSMIAGGALVTNAFSSARDGTPRVGSNFLGVALIGGGGATIGFSAVKMQSRSVPYEIARDVAVEYNNQLAHELGQE